jgi:hypothetical protein
MRLRHRIFFTAASLLIALSLTPSAQAISLANRVFVSARSGNDANTCNNILTPCQTFAGAVLQLNPGGEAIVLDSGGYGPVTITQSLTIEAPPGVVAFIHPPSGNAISVNAGSGVVILRGLVLNGGGSGDGINVSTAGSVYIENCVISGFDRGVYLAGANTTFIKDTICRQSLNGGAVVLSGRMSADHCRFEGNGGDGIFVEGADVTIRDSVFGGNGGSGFTVTAFGSQNSILNVYDCMSTNNGGNGFEAFNGGTGFVFARVANSSVNENIGIGLDNLGNSGGGSMAFVSLGNNFVEGNVGGVTSGTITPVTPH